MYMFTVCYAMLLFRDTYMPVLVRVIFGINVPLPDIFDRFGARRFLRGNYVKGCAAMHMCMGPPT